MRIRMPAIAARYWPKPNRTVSRMPITATIPDAVAVDTAQRRPPGPDPPSRCRGWSRPTATCAPSTAWTSRSRPGTVLGLLGPNGAGKTTTVRALTTLLKPDAGEIVVDGVDAIADPAELREHIGLAGQYASVDESLTGKENLVMVGRLYGMKRKDATARGGRAAGRSSTCPTPPTAWSRSTRAACAAGWTWPRRWWPSRRCCSWTSRPRAWTRAAGWTCGP